MSFTSPTDDIIVQEGTFAYNFTASGTIKGGQAVEVQDTMKVAASLGSKAQYDNSKVIGVAAYDVTDKEYVAVYGPGNIVRVIISGTSKCGVGNVMIPGSDGKFQARPTTGAFISGIKAIALETQATADGTARVLLI